jgi:hypothetical protein
LWCFSSLVPGTVWYNPIRINYRCIFLSRFCMQQEKLLQSELVIFAYYYFGFLNQSSSIWTCIFRWNVLKCFSYFLVKLDVLLFSPSPCVHYWWMPPQCLCNFDNATSTCSNSFSQTWFFLLPFYFFSAF